MTKIARSVGRGGVNLYNDVITIKKLLNKQRLPGVTGELKYDGDAGKETITRIEIFQKNIVKMPKPDGRIDPGGMTMAKLTAEEKTTKKTNNTNKEFNLLVATIYGEANNSSEIAWKTIAHVINNRVGKKEWKKHTTVTDIITKTGFDAYTHNTSNFKRAFDYLKGTDGKTNALIDKMVNALEPVYLRQEKDITFGAILYYSPKAQAALYKTKPNLYKETPAWNFSLLDKVTIPGLLATDDFNFYKYK